MTFPENLLNEGEKIVISTRTHPKALLGPGLIVLLALVVDIALFRLLDNGRIRTVLMHAFLVVVAWFVVGPLLRWLTTTYTFTNRRFIKRSGFVSKSGRTIPLNRISGVDFEIGVIDRIFGCGTLVVSDASTDGSVELHDIPHVEQVQLRVADELHRLGEGGRLDDGS